MDRFAAALVLHEIGALLEVHGENRFRARAFLNAARAVADASEDVAALVAAGQAERLKGIGPATASVLTELASSGSSSLHQDLRARTPPGLIELLAVPGLGATRVHQVRKQLGVDSLAALEQAARDGHLAALSGFGERTQAKVLEGIAFLRSQVGRRRQPDALAIADWVAGFLGSLPATVRSEVAGEARRRLETVDSVDVVAATARPDDIVRAFLALPGSAAGERTGEGSARNRLADGLELRLLAVPVAEFAAQLLAATGSEMHLAALRERAAQRGLRLDPHGLWRGTRRVRASEEAGLYRALGLDYIPPELREAVGEIEAAEAGGLPALLTYADLRGCFHCHTEWSDGRTSVRELAEAARTRRWRYLGISDHSQAASYAGGLSPDDLRRQGEEIDAWNEEHGGELWIFKGVEADILPDGRLDYADEAGDPLAGLDFVVGSIHSGFRTAADAMTQRVLRALEDPRLTFLGHPTGRLLLSRAGYGIDLDAVIAQAARHGVVIEINSNPRRMELDWRHWRTARAAGVLAAVNPDAHSPPELGYVRFGVNVARKGWLGPADVVNAWELDEVRRLLARRKRAA